MKYKYDKVNYISYNELLYLIEPITQMLKYQKDNKKLKSIQADPNALITSKVYIKDKIFENRLLEVHKYFVSDINTGMPISYYFISNGIPYMLKDEKKIKRDNNKLLVK